MPLVLSPLLLFLQNGSSSTAGTHATRFVPACIVYLCGFVARATVNSLQEKHEEGKKIKIKLQLSISPPQGIGLDSPEGGRIAKAPVGDRVAASTERF